MRFACYFYSSDRKGGGRAATYRERAAAYGERLFTKYKYKDYERVIEIMESRLRGGRFFK